MCKYEIWFGFDGCRDSFWIDSDVEPAVGTVYEGWKVTEVYEVADSGYL